MSKQLKPKNTAAILQTQLTNTLINYIKDAALASRVRDSIQKTLTTKITTNWKQYLQLFMQDQTAMLAFLYKDIKETINDELLEAGVPLTIDKIVVIAGAALGAYAGYKVGAAIGGTLTASVVPKEYQGIANTTLTLVTTTAGAISGAMTTSALLEQWNKSQEFLLKKGHMLLRGETNKPEHAKSAPMPRDRPNFMMRNNENLITRLSRDPQFQTLTALVEHDIYSLLSGKEASRPSEEEKSIFVVAGYPKSVDRTKEGRGENLSKLIDINILCQSLMLQTQALGATSQEEAEAQLSLLQLLYNWSALGIDLIRKETSGDHTLIIDILKQIKLYHDEALANIKDRFSTERASTAFNQIRLAAFSQFSETKAAIEAETKSQWDKLTELTDGFKARDLTKSPINAENEYTESKKTATHPLVEIGRSTTTTLMAKAPEIIRENSGTIAQNIADTVKSTAKKTAKEALNQVGLHTMGGAAQTAANVLLDKAVERLAEFTKDMANEALSKDTLQNITKEIFEKTSHSSARSGATDDFIRETGMIPPGLAAKHAVITFPSVYELNEDGSATFKNFGEAYNALESQLSISRTEDYSARLLLRNSWHTASMQSDATTPETKYSQLKADKKKVSDFLKIYKGSKISQNSEMHFNTWYQDNEETIRIKITDSIKAKKTKNLINEYLTLPENDDETERNATEKLKRAIQEKLKQHLISEQSIVDLYSHDPTPFHNRYQQKKHTFIESFSISGTSAEDENESDSLNTKLAKDFDTYFLIHEANTDKIDFILEGNETVQNELQRSMALLILQNENMTTMQPEEAAPEEEAAPVEAAAAPEAAAPEPAEGETPEQKAEEEIIFFQTGLSNVTEASKITEKLIEKKDPDTTLTHVEIMQNLRTVRGSFLSQLNEKIKSSPMLMALTEHITPLKGIAAEIYLKKTISGATSTSRPRDLLIEAYSQFIEHRPETPTAETKQSDENQENLLETLFHGFFEKMLSKHSEAQTPKQDPEEAHSPRDSKTGKKRLIFGKTTENFEQSFRKIYSESTGTENTKNPTSVQLKSLLDQETVFKSAASAILSDNECFNQISIDPGSFESWLKKPTHDFMRTAVKTFSSLRDSAEEQASRLHTTFQGIFNTIEGRVIHAADTAKKSLAEAVDSAAQKLGPGIDALKKELKEATFGPQKTPSQERANSESEHQDATAKADADKYKAALKEHLGHTFDGTHSYFSQQLSTVAENNDFASLFSTKDKTRKEAKKAFLRSTAKKIKKNPNQKFLQNVENFLQVACHRVRRNNHLKPTNSLKAIAAIVARGLQNRPENEELKKSCQHFTQSLVLLMMKNDAIYNPGQDIPADNTKLSLLSGHNSDSLTTKDLDIRRITKAGFKPSARRELLALQTILFRSLVGAPAEGTAPAADDTAPTAEGTAPLAEGTAPAEDNTAPPADDTAPAADVPKTLKNTLQTSETLGDDAYTGLDQRKIILMVQLAICVNREAFNAKNISPHKLRNNFLENSSTSNKLTRDIAAEPTDEPAAAPPPPAT